VVSSLLSPSSESANSSALTGKSVFAGGLLGATYASGASGSFTYTSSDEFKANLAGNNAITLALLGLNSYGNGFQSMTLTVTNGTTTLLSKTFTTAATAQTYFADDPVAVGTLSGTVDLTVTTSLTANSATGVSEDLLLGSVAVPAAAKRTPRRLIPVYSGNVASLSSGTSVTRIAKSASILLATRKAQESPIREVHHARR
jgi:hypothetical protein